ncbi:hypothetical protein L9F63_023377 [Diploptera punctata]|uniref:Gustatory receptor n=1 Tax=Diploptera punctata TaxID=6984 RepID=A0AAD7ZJE5_DIPPU|nr:hypothetical protein L9F63_023377 [Diploptera punctata]
MYQLSPSSKILRVSRKATSYQHNILTAIKPLYYVSKIMGLAPFSFIKHITTNQITIQSSRRGNIYTFFLLLSIIICKAISMVGRTKYTYPTLVTTLSITDFMVWVSSGICMIASFVVATTWGQTKLIRILRKMSYIDEMLLEDSSNNYRKISRFLTLQLMLLFSAVGGVCIYDYFVKIYHIGNILLSYVPSIYLNFLIMYAITAQFVNLILLIWHRFRVLNSHLITKYNFDKTTIQNIDQQCSDYISINNNHRQQWIINNQHFNDEENSNENKQIKPKKKKSEVIIEIERKLSNDFQPLNFSQLRKLRILHSLLNDCAVLTSSMYGFQILLDMSNTLIRTTTYLYNIVTMAVGIYSSSSSQYVERKKHIFILNMCWIPIFIVKMTSVALTCHLASSEANRTIILLQKSLLIQNIDQKVRTEIQEFIQQVQNQKLQFKACGFFKIDLTMLKALIVAIFTYLLILMQFYIPK